MRFFVSVSLCECQDQAFTRDYNRPITAVRLYSLHKNSNMLEIRKRTHFNTNIRNGFVKTRYELKTRKIS